MKDLEDEMSNLKTLLANEKDNVKNLKAQRAENILKIEDLQKKLLETDAPPAP